MLLCGRTSRHLQRLQILYPASRLTIPAVRSPILGKAGSDLTAKLVTDITLPPNVMSVRLVSVVNQIDGSLVNLFEGQSAA